MFKKDNLKAAIPIFLCGSFTLASLTVLFKYVQLTYKMSTSEIVFIRMTMILLISVPLHFKTFLNMFVSKAFGINFLRNGIFVFTVYSWYFGVKNVKVAEAIVISFLTPFTSLILSGVFMKEKINKKIWLVTLLCFVGVVLTLWAPSNKTIKPETFKFAFFEMDLRLFAIIVLFITAFARGIVNLLTKGFTNKGGNPTELTLLNVFLVFLSSMDVFFSEMKPIPVMALVLIGVTGLLYYAETWLYSKAYSLAKVSTLQPFDFSRVIFSSIVSYFLLGEKINMLQYFSIGIILIAYIYYFFPSKK